MKKTIAKVILWVLGLSFLGLTVWAVIDVMAGDIGYSMAIRIVLGAIAACGIVFWCLKTLEE